METWDAVRARRNVRDYTAEPLTADELDRILEAGRRAPSASNGQPWDLVVVTERDLLVRLAEVWQYAGHVARSAATIVVVAPIVADEREDRMIEYDLGQQTMQMMLAAADLGIGSGHAAIADQDLLRGLLGIPEDHRGAYLIALGRPANGPLRPLTRINRRRLDEVVHRERW
jgi:nitroreductase